MERGKNRVIVVFCYLSCLLINGLLGQAIYVDQIRYIPESKEFYLTIPFAVGEDYKLFQQLENQTTAHPQSSPGFERRKLPLALAQEYFDLSPYRDLLIFNASHELVCEAVFKGVELFTDYESYFVAVLHARNGLASLISRESSFYCLSKTAEPLLTERFISRPLEAASLDDRIANWFTLSEDQQPAIRHTLLYPENTVYSVLSYFEERPAHRYRTHSYLLETRKDDLSILMKVQGQTEHDQIYSLQALPIQVRRRPVLLLDMGETDTDIRWCQLAVYTGSEYELIEGNWVVLR